MSESDKKAALPMLQSDSRLIIVAGSDTTAATLVHMFYYIANDQSVLQKLRDELEPLVGDGRLEHQKIQDAEYLNGCIYEALRLNPPVPSGVFRKTPPEGVNIGDTWIAGDTCIQMPQYAMGRGKTLKNTSSITLRKEEDYMLTLHSSLPQTQRSTKVRTISSPTAGTPKTWIGWSSTKTPGVPFRLGRLGVSEKILLCWK